MIVGDANPGAMSNEERQLMYPGPALHTGRRQASLRPLVQQFRVLDRSFRHDGRSRDQDKRSLKQNATGQLSTENGSCLLNGDKTSLETIDLSLGVTELPSNEEGGRLVPRGRRGWPRGSGKGSRAASAERGRLGAGGEVPDPETTYCLVHPLGTRAPRWE